MNTLKKDYNVLSYSYFKDKFIRYKLKLEMKNLERDFGNVINFSIIILTIILYIIVTIYSYFIIMENII